MRHTSAIWCVLNLLRWGGCLLAGMAPAGMTAAEPDALRARLREHLLVPDPLPAPAARTHRTFSPAPGVRAEAVTYTTQFGQRVPAILYLPDPLPAGGRIPAFIVVNGHGGDKYAWYAYYTGVAFARGGIAVLTYDQAGEGERSGSRTSGTREHDRLKGDERMARRLAGLMITDAMQAVSFLRTRAEVDPARIGAGGYSLGSFVLALAGAIDQRLRACVLVGGGNLDHPGGYWDRSKPMCQGLPYQSLAFLGDRPATIYTLHAARGPLLIWNGREDTVVNMPKTQDAFFADLRARVMAQRGGSATGVFEFGFTAEASHRPFWLTRPVVAWLERELDFPAWEPEAITTLPETLIGAWSAGTGYPMDKLYATDEREGGTRAIGTGVPGISREQLSVFSPGEWARARHELTFDAWVEAVRRNGAH